MSDIKATLNFGKIFYNRSGDPAKDLIDPPIGRTEENAPDLTYGSFISNALMLGIAKVTPKEAFKYFQIASDIDQALKENNGLIEWNEGQISQFEEAIQKIQSPLFTQPFHLGPIQQMINDAKVEILAKHKAK